MNESKADALVGRTIAGKFRIESFIGAGAMGAVYKARQMALEKVIALKVLHPDRAEDRMYAALFHREARAASRLDHPNSVRVVDFGQEPDGLLYIAMEYFAGRDLQRLLTDDWPLSPYRVADILSQALAAIAVAHEMGIVHRDLKPENILLQQGQDDEGEAHDVVKVCDFGIAKFTNAGEGEPGRTGRTARHATEGLVFGTPHYMAPEQARGEGLDARTDLYSIGVILYQMLTSRLPFEGKTLLDVAIKHIHDEPLRPSQHADWVDERLETICLKALRKRKEDRYQSARAMRADLRAVMSAPPSTREVPRPHSSRDAPTQPPQDPDRLPTSQTPGPTSSPLRRLRRRAALPLLVLLVLSTIVVAGVGALRARPHHSNAVVATQRPSSEGVDSHLLQAKTSNTAPNLEIASNVRMLPSLEASEPVGTAPSKQSARPNAHAKGKAAAPAFAADPTAAEAVESSSQSEKDRAISPSLPAAAPVTVTESASPIAGSTAIPPAATTTPATAHQPAMRFDPSRARVDWSVAATGGGATASDVRRSLSHASESWNTCYQNALRMGGQRVEGSGVLHIATDEEGNVVQSAVRGFALSSAAACIAGSARVRIAGVDTGSAWADLKLVFRAEGPE